MPNRFWVGGTGNWSSTARWSTTSGGAGGASVPTAADDAIFNALSGSKYVATIDTNQTVGSISITPTAGAGATQFVFAARLTTGNLTTTGTAGNNRIFFRGTTFGIARDFEVNGTVSVTDCDFRDIYVIGTAAPISGTRIGDLGGIRGITPSAPKTCFWNNAAQSNWNTDSWAATSGGTPNTNNYPLPQDTAVINNSSGIGSNIIQMVVGNQYLPNVDFSARSTPVQFNITQAIGIYGSLTLSTSVSLQGTQTLTFEGRGNYTITSAGRTFSNGGITVNSFGGSVELADALLFGLSPSLTVNSGTFDTKGYNVTAASLLSSSNSVREIRLGASTVTLRGSTSVNFTTDNITFDAGTSSIIVTAPGVSFSGGNNQIFHNVSFTNDGGSISISDITTFNDLSITAPSSASLRIANFGNNQNINGTLTVNGATAVRRILLASSFFGTTLTLTVNSLSAQDCDFRDIAIAGTAAGSAPTRAGDCGGNAGITFPAAKTVFWNLAGTQNWSATGWAATSGGAPSINNFPLAQDTAVFDNTGAAGTVTAQTFNIGTFDASARTSAMTLTTSTNTPTVHGNWLFGTGVTSTSATGPITFSGRSTATITSNGVIFGCPISINQATGTVQLADALALDSVRTLTLNRGTFDAVTYNVTTGLFDLSNSNTRTLRMGSGTWTLSGTGTLWNAASTTSLAFYKGTANILLSNTGTGARTFSGGGQNYNRLTIGGTTGISTTTIVGNNQFDELASTKTVAHTVALGVTVQVFGAWTITGTVGNVVTVSGTGTAHILAGACTNNINFLAMGSNGFSPNSPGEFYAGPNSTGTAVAPVYRTAKPADSTRYWVGGTGNWSDTNRWSTSSGGAGGASVPRSHDDVIFDSASNATAYTATVNTVTGGIRTKALTIAGPLVGNLTLAGAAQPIVGVHGDVTFPATGLTRTWTGEITLTGSATGRTLTTNGVTLAGSIIIRGVNCGWSLGSAVTTTGFLVLLDGAFNFATYTLTAGVLLSNYLSSRAVDFSSGTAVLTSQSFVNFGTTESERANLTVTAGTSQITAANDLPTLTGNNQTFHNVSFVGASTSGIITINGTNTFNNFSVGGRVDPGVNNVIISANQTINGTLTFSAGTNAAARTFVRSISTLLPRTLTCAAFSGTDADFRFITIAGAAAPVSGTRLGDCKGNSGITFVAGADKYWNLAGGGNWSAVGWATSSGGAVSNDNFPLAQDTCLFESTGLNSGATVTVNAPYNIGTIDMSARTSNTMTLATGINNPTIYGNWINGTGTTLTGTGFLFYFSSGGTTTITSAGRTFTQGLSIVAGSGTIQLQDAFNSTNGITLNHGTFDAATYNATFTGSVQSSPSVGTNARTLAIGSGTWTTSASGAATWNTGGGGFSITGTGTINLTSFSAKTFTGQSGNYSGITLNQGGTGALTITGSNTFKDITNTATGATTINLGTTTQRVEQWTGTGTSTRVLTITGTSATSPATLILTGPGKPDVNFLNIIGVRAYSLTNTWFANTTSTNNGSLGWLFEAPILAIDAFISELSLASDSVSGSSSALYEVSVVESSIALDSISASGVFVRVAFESATALDNISARGIFSITASETATTVDSTSASFNLLGSVSETCSVVDLVVAGSLFDGAVSEAAVVVDLISASKSFTGVLSESVTSADVQSNTAVFTVNALETITASDAAAAGFICLGTLSESATVVDVTEAFRLFLAAIFEATTATDLMAASLTLAATISELTTASDALANVYTTNPTISELASIADALSGGLLFLSNISEATTAQEIATAVLIFNRAVAEATTASEVLAAVAVFHAAVPEQVSGADVANALITVGGSINEALTALDSVVNANTTRPNISESATASEAQTNVFTANSAVAELAQGTDVASAAGSMFNAVALAAAQAADSFSPAGSIYNAALPIESALAADSVLGAYLWNLIDDNQTPNWQNVVNPQGLGWVQINTDDTPNWQPTITP